MEWLQALTLWVIAAIALIYFGLGLFNVDWRLRVRILTSLGIGAATVGAVGWHLVRPIDPLGPVSMFTGEVSTADTVILIALGFAAGALATLACYPLGSALGPFAAPAGAAVLALSSGSMRNLLLYNQDFHQRSQMYAFLRWEVLFWLALCAAGLAAAFIISRLVHTKTVLPGDAEHPIKPASKVTNGVIGAVASAFIVYFTLGIFAQDLRHMDEKLGSVVGLPGNGQIAFGVFVSVGLAAFLIRYLLQVCYAWAVLGAAGVYFVMFGRLSGSETLEYLASQWPIDYLSRSIYGITPLQFMAFAFLGALTGFWIAIHWQQKAAAEEK